MTTPYKLLQFALALFGLITLLLYPLAVVWPSGWAWHAGAPYESQYFMMIVGLYATIGAFLLNAARKPEANSFPVSVSERQPNSTGPRASVC
jgi:hypothetical protein